MVLAFNACPFTNHFLRYSEADVGYRPPIHA